MKKKSIIIISLLIVIIIILVTALIFTISCNRRLSGEGELGAENTEENAVFEPLYISLDSDIVADMYKRVNITPHYVFHKFEGTELNLENIPDDDINTAAFYYSKLDSKVEQMDPIVSMGHSGKLDTIFMDSAVKKMFGNIEYNYGNIYFIQDNLYYVKYDETDKVFYKLSGFGGGNTPLKYSVITEVIEYEDRYEAKEMFIFGHYYPSEEYAVKDYDGNEIVERYSKEQIDAMESTIIGYSPESIDKKILTTHKDDAYGYKHTFTKNSDGTYTWAKTEKLN